MGAQASKANGRANPTQQALAREARQRITRGRATNGRAHRECPRFTAGEAAEPPARPLCGRLSRLAVGGKEPPPKLGARTGTHRPRPWAGADRVRPQPETAGAEFVLSLHQEPHGTDHRLYIADSRHLPARTSLRMRVQPDLRADLRAGAKKNGRVGAKGAVVLRHEAYPPRGVQVFAA